MAKRNGENYIKSVNILTNVILIGIIIRLLLLALLLHRSLLLLLLQNLLKLLLHLLLRVYERRKSGESSIKNFIKLKKQKQIHRLQCFKLNVCYYEDVHQTVDKILH